MTDRGDMGQMFDKLTVWLVRMFVRVFVSQNIDNIDMIYVISKVSF
jgi:hypothetical protein